MKERPKRILRSRECKASQAACLKECLAISLAARKAMGSNVTFGIQASDREQS